MRNARLDEAQAGMKIWGRNINNLRYADNTTLSRKQKETKEPLLEGERGEWNSWLKTQHSENEDHDIWSHTSWQIVGETMETVTDFIVIHTVKGFGVVSKAEIDVFLELSCFFDDPMNVGTFDLWFLGLS